MDETSVQDEVAGQGNEGGAPTVSNTGRESEMGMVSPSLPSLQRALCIYGTILLVVVSLLYAAGRKGVPLQPLSPLPTIEEFAEIREKANAGDAESQLYMGVFYANGDVAEQDYPKAVEWYRKAAEQGEARAQRYLGLLLSLGVGVERDRQAAFEWFRKADKQGDPAASLEISAYPLFYRESIMSFQMGSFDAWRAKAFFLIELDESIPSLEWNFWKKYSMKNRYTQNDLLLAKFVEDRANTGDAEAQTDMVKLHIFGQGVPAEPASIEKWLLSAVESGEPYAQFMYGYSWENPYFSSIPYTMRLMLLEAAAISKREPFFKLIHCMLKYAWVLDGSEKTGTFILKNRTILIDEIDEKYINELNDLVESDCFLAKWVLAKHLNLKENFQENSAELFKEISKNGFIYADLELMRMYILGEGVDVSYEKALECIRRLQQYPDKDVWENMAWRMSFAFPKNSAKWEKLHLFAQWVFKRAESGDAGAQLFSAILCAPELLNDNEMEKNGIFLLLSAITALRMQSFHGVSCQAMIKFHCFFL